MATQPDKTGLTQIEPVTCPSCTSDRLVRVGRIPDSDVFAGRKQAIPIDGGHLYRCNECFVLFRYPVRSEHDLNAQYIIDSEEVWECGACEREDWRIARLWIRQHLPVGSSILDVGCFDGSFLETLKFDYGKYGVEIQSRAADRASQKGVKIIAARYEDLDGLTEKFDAIVSFDLVEHVHNPIRFLSTLCSALQPSGIIILSSGNAEAKTWRLMGARYWYCAITEHISFINPSWCAHAAFRVGLRIERTEQFSHIESTVSQKLNETVKNLLYFASPGAAGWLRQRGLGGKDARGFQSLSEHPPSWMSARDHLIFLGRKICGVTS